MAYIIPVSERLHKVLNDLSNILKSENTNMPPIQDNKKKHFELKNLRPLKKNKKETFDRYDEGKNLVLHDFSCYFDKLQVNDLSIYS